MTTRTRSIRSLLLAATAFVLGGGANAPVSASARVVPPHLVLTDATGPAELRRYADLLTAHGARIHHFFPPDAALGDVPADLDPDALPGLRGHVLVLRDPGAAAKAVAPRMPACLAPAFGRLAGAWQQLAVDWPEGQGTPLWGDAIPAVNDAEGAAPGRNGDATGLLPGSSSLTPPCTNASWTSAYFLGDVTIGILLPESANPAENSEDWTTAREDQVVAEIVAGTAQLAAGYPDAGLDFFFEVSRAIPTQVEPIIHDSGERNAWIQDVLAYLGEPNMGTYVRSLRARNLTDWATAAFVVDSRNDSDGEFPDGKFAFAYIGGPYMVLTWDNDGWGIGGMDSVFAHELGHNFQALDEYAAAGIPCDRRCGVLQVETQNSQAGSCQSNRSCLMRSNQFPNLHCSWSEGQLGLRDTDGNGIPDLRDTKPQSELNPADPNPSPSADVTFTGTASALPAAQEVSFPPLHTLNKIVGVEVRLDGGAWTPAIPSDGSWGDLCEPFEATFTGLADGWHDVESRAIASLCDPRDTDICNPVRTATETTLPLERVYVNANCAEDAFEPNDRPGEEASVPAGAIENLMLCAFDPDRFRLYLRAGASLTARMEYTDPAAAVSLDLYAPSGLLIASAPGAAGVAEVTLAAATETGSHVLVASGVAEAQTAYRLVLTASCIDDGLEPNPGPAQAVPLPLGATRDLQICGGDEDWYAFSISDGADLTVTLNHAAALGDLDLELYAPDQTLLSRSATTGDVETVTATGRPGGVHRVRVLGASPLDENRYDLTVATTGCLDDLAENDDDPATARPGPGRFTAHICSGDDDWVRLDLLEAALVRIELVFSSTFSILEVEVRDAAGTVIANGAGGGGVRRVDLERLPPGTYFVRVFAPSGTADVDYTLDVHTADPLLLLAVKRTDDVLLDWNDAGIECYLVRRSVVPETFNGGFETVVDVTAAAPESADPTEWTDVARIPDGLLQYYDVQPTACAGSLLRALKTVNQYPVYDQRSLTGLIFTIDVYNDGREPATSLSVYDDVPPGILAASVVEMPPGAVDLSRSSGGRFGRGFVQVDGFSLDPGQSARVRFRLIPGGVTTNSSILRNQGTVTGLNAGGQIVRTLTDDPSTYAALDSTDVVTLRSAGPEVTVFWNQDVNIDMRIVDPCGNMIGPADRPMAECPVGQQSMTLLATGSCGDVWPFGWFERITATVSPVVPAQGTYEVFVRYSQSNRDLGSGCRHGGLEDVVVLVETGSAWFDRWMVLDPADTSWIPAATFTLP